jgi:Cu2+-exporting ATPase
MSGHEHHHEHPVAEAPEAAHASHEHHDHASGASATGHDHSHHDPAQFRRKFWLSLILTIPTLVFSTGLQDILGLPGPRFPGSQFIPAAFGLAVFVYGGLVFLRGAVGELRSRKPGMMTLISLAIVVALGYSLAVTLGLPGMDFWWELATLVTIMLLGHWIEMSAVQGARDALGELAKLLPDEAELVHGDHIMTVPIAQLKAGDFVLVRPGAKVPADGEVTDGESDVDEALVTGESAPVDKTVGSAVIAGTVNGGGALTVRVTSTGEATALGGIMRLVAEAQSSKSGAQLLADRAAGILFYVALGAAIITLIVWFFLKPDDPNFVLERVVSVLVIACPHALGLAIPLVSQLSTAIGARNGILVRDRHALEDARRVDVVLFDKTGTLTTGQQGVVAIDATGETAEDEVLALAAAVEAKSEHPIARAIVARAKESKVKVPRATKFQALSGRGATATVDGRVVTVSSARLVTERGHRLDPALVNSARELGAQGATVVYVMDGDRVLGLVAVADTVRPESAEAVAELKRRGVRVEMLTGDSTAVGQWVASQLGIDEVHAEVLPAQKAEVVSKLQAGGAKVAMVGDGVNDAPALAQADVGIAIGAGTDVAIESAGIVLASSDPRAVPDVLKLSRATWRKELQNLFWATGYNAVGIPLAAGVAFGAGVLLPPALAAVFMSASTVIVALNAQLLRTLKLGR